MEIKTVMICLIFLILLIQCLTNNAFMIKIICNKAFFLRIWLIMGPEPM